MTDAGMRKVLIVDDEPSVRFVLARTCERAGVSHVEAGSAEEAREELQRHGTDRHGGIGLVLLDVRLPGDDGFTLLGELSARTDSPFVVVMTAEDTMRSAVEAMKRGAADYLGKPFDLNRVERIVRDLAIGPEPDDRSERGAARAPEPERKRDGAPLESLIGRSPAMVEVFKEIGRVARTEMTVTLMGESGTGKELVARAIHSNSARARGPFITVNMAAIPRDLMESELYGHERGAFTGAAERRPGKFELAGGGTLFLDEIGEMPVELQAKLLRVLQEREIDRVGGSRPLPVDVRIIAATNADLSRSVEEGRFRRDLFYRLAVVPLRIPPLRERREDVPLLAAHFLERHNRRTGAARSFSPEALARLVGHDWPGNVRELENVVEQAAALSEGPVIRAPDIAFPAEGAPRGPAEGGSPTLAGAVAAAERRCIEAAVLRCGGDLGRVARELAVSSTTLWRRMRRLGIPPPGGGAGG